MRNTDKQANKCILSLEDRDMNNDNA